MNINKPKDINAREAPMLTFICKIIRSFHGYHYDAGGIVNGFFSDVELAKKCAAAIVAEFGKEVSVCGTQIKIDL